MAPATLYRVDENGIVSLMPTDDVRGREQLTSVTEEASGRTIARMPRCSMLRAP